MDFTNIDPNDTLYKRLMVDESADSEVIQLVYRRLARRHHPDVDPSREAERRMATLNEAYAVLHDPALRAQYDAALAARRDHSATARMVPQHSGAGQSSGPAHSQARFGEAGTPIGPPAGSLVNFGRYRGWTLGQIRHRDPDFLEWLMKMPIGRPYREEITTLLRRSA
jgi:DnaJ-class molecular chaperone